MSWRRIFERLDLTWCPACDLHVHDHGALVGRTIHWRDRRMSRPALYTVLRLIAVGQGYYDDFAPWRRTYLINRDVLAMAREIKTRLPRDVFELDRAKLRHELSGYTLADRRRMLPSEQHDFRAALRWAARS